MSHWMVECQKCHGPFIEYHGEQVPVAGEFVEPHIRAGLFRHSDGRVVFMGEPAKCDTCGSDPEIETLEYPIEGEIVRAFTVRHLTFMSPSYFKRVDSKVQA